MPVRPGAKRFLDKDYAATLANDPLLTGVPGISFSSEDEQVLFKLMQKMLESKPGLENQIAEKAGMFKRMLDYRDRAAAAGREIPNIWETSGRDYMNRAMNKLYSTGQKLVPGLNRDIYEYSHLPSTMNVNSAWLGKNLNPLGTLTYDTVPGKAHIGMFAADLADKSFASRMAPLHLLKGFAEHIGEKGIDVVDPGIFSEYTGNLLEDILNRFRKKGMMPTLLSSEAEIPSEAATRTAARPASRAASRAASTFRSGESRLGPAYIFGPHGTRLAGLETFFPQNIWESLPEADRTNFINMWLREGPHQNLNVMDMVRQMRVISEGLQRR